MGKKRKKQTVLETAEKKQKQECEAEIANLAKLAGMPSTNPLVIKQYEKQIEILAKELEQLELEQKVEYDYGVPYRTALDKTLGILKSPYS